MVSLASALRRQATERSVSPRKSGTQAPAWRRSGDAAMNDREILTLEVARDVARDVARYERLLRESYLDESSLRIIRQLLADARIQLAQTAEADGRRW
jgi:hypothetical protein